MSPRAASLRALDDRAAASRRAVSHGAVAVGALRECFEARRGAVFEERLEADAVGGDDGVVLTDVRDPRGVRARRRERPSDGPHPADEGGARDEAPRGHREGASLERAPREHHRGPHEEDHGEGPERGPRRERRARAEPPTAAQQRGPEREAEEPVLSKEGALEPHEGARLLAPPDHDGDAERAEPEGPPGDREGGDEEPHVDQRERGEERLARGAEGAERAAEHRPRGRGVVPVVGLDAVPVRVVADGAEARDVAAEGPPARLAEGRVAAVGGGEGAGRGDDLVALEIAHRAAAGARRALAPRPRRRPRTRRCPCTRARGSTSTQVVMEGCRGGERAGPTWGP